MTDIVQDRGVHNFFCFYRFYLIASDKADSIYDTLIVLPGPFLDR